MTPPPRIGAAVGAGLLAASTLATAACSSDDGSSGSASDTKVITVLAASSLTEAFGDLKNQVEKDNPGLEVRVSFAASSTIVQQVNNGAEADIVALADEKAGSTLKTEIVGEGGPTEVFATNQLAIATPPKNPAKVDDLADLTNPDVDTVLCAEQVPCGRAAKTVLGKGNVTPHVISYEQDVKATLAKVRLGEADAGIVYLTDVTAAGDSVHGVKIKPEQNVTTRLPIYTLTNNSGTHAFVDLLMSAAGRKVLTDRGFGTP